MWTRSTANRRPNRPKIAPDAPTAKRASLNANEASETAGGEQQVEGEEAPSAVEALHERPGEPQCVHVEREVEEPAVDERDRPQPPQLPVRDGHLVEQEDLENLRADRARELDGERHDRGDRHDHDRDRQAHVAACPGEVLPRGARVAELLGQPAEPVGDLGAILLRRALLRLPVGVERPAQVLRPDAPGRDVAPREVRGRVLGKTRRLLPRTERGVVLVHPVERLAEPDVRRGGDRGIVEADDALVQARGIAELGVGDELGGPGRGRQAPSPG